MMRLMALLLTFFVLLLSFSTTSQHYFQKASGALQGALGVLDGEPIMISPINLHVPIIKGDITEARPTLKDAKAEIEEEVEASGQEENIEVVQGPDGLIVRIKEGALFQIGGADIQDAFVIDGNLPEVVNTEGFGRICRWSYGLEKVFEDVEAKDHWKGDVKKLRTKWSLLPEYHSSEGLLCKLIVTEADDVVKKRLEQPALFNKWLAKSSSA